VRERLDVLDNCVQVESLSRAGSADRHPLDLGIGQHMRVRATAKRVSQAALFISGCAAGVVVTDWAIGALPVWKNLALAMAIVAALLSFPFLILAVARFTPKWRSLACGFAIGVATCASLIAFAAAFVSFGPRID
jgi:hypothetical protein